MARRLLNMKDVICISDRFPLVSSMLTIKSRKDLQVFKDVIKLTRV